MRVFFNARLFFLSFLFLLLELKLTAPTSESINFNTSSREKLFITSTQMYNFRYFII